jgi:hypothetical protein
MFGGYAVDEFVVRAIREEDLQACIDLWCEVWPGEGSPAYFRRYFYGDVEHLPYYTQVGVLNGKIVSAVHICKRTVACGELQLTMGGIANVATLPDYRGRGYNTRCLQSAVAVMEADAMDFSLLFTGINDYYSRQGYDTLPRHWTSGTVRPDFIAPPSEFTVRPATADDLPAIQECYADYNRYRPIAVQRTPAYWRDWMNVQPHHVPGGLMVALDAVGSVRGYMQTGVFKSAIAYSPDAVGMRATEYGTSAGVSPQQEDDIALALLHSVITGVLEEGPASILRVDIARTPAIEQALRTLLTEQTPHTNTSGMVRVLHRDNLLRSLAMGLNDRWIGAGRPQGRLTFATPYGPATLDANGTFLRVTAEAAEGSEVLPQAVLFALLFGMISPGEATQDANLHPLIAALFPPQATVYYGADGF